MIWTGVLLTIFLKIKEKAEDWGINLASKGFKRLFRKIINKKEVRRIFSEDLTEIEFIDIVKSAIREVWNEEIPELKNYIQEIIDSSIEEALLPEVSQQRSRKHLQQIYVLLKEMNKQLSFSKDAASLIYEISEIIGRMSEKAEYSEKENQIIDLFLIKSNRMILEKLNGLVQDVNNVNQYLSQLKSNGRDQPVTIECEDYEKALNYLVSVGGFYGITGETHIQQVFMLKGNIPGNLDRVSFHFEGLKLDLGAESPDETILGYGRYSIAVLRRSYRINNLEKTSAEFISLYVFEKTELTTAKKIAQVIDNHIFSLEIEKKIRDLINSEDYIKLINKWPPDEDSINLFTRVKAIFDQSIKVLDDKLDYVSMTMIDSFKITDWLTTSDIERHDRIQAFYDHPLSYLDVSEGTAQGKRYSEAIIETLESLIKFFKKGQSWSLSSEETFILLLAIHFHNIGRLYNRSIKEINDKVSSTDFIADQRRILELLGLRLNTLEYKYLQTLIQGATLQQSSREGISLSDIKDNTYSLDEERFRLPLLAALIRITKICTFSSKLYNQDLIQFFDIKDDVGRTIAESDVQIVFERKEQEIIVQYWAKSPEKRQIIISNILYPLWINHILAKEILEENGFYISKIIEFPVNKSINEFPTNYIRKYYQTDQIEEIYSVIKILRDYVTIFFEGTELEQKILSEYKQRVENIVLLNPKPIYGEELENKLLVGNTPEEIRNLKKESLILSQFFDLLFSGLIYS
ncbi:MAG: HD domain-containing protein [Candidatus Hodarchaeales archaeon]|jgi:hypothetical protein